jgi:hypothetical protein
MNRTQLQRRTVDEDPDAVPGAQIYLEASGRVWHDLKFVHASLAKHGLNRVWTSYRHDLKRMWRQAQVEETHFHLDVAASSQVSMICSSVALVMALWVHVACGRTRTVVQKCSAWLRSMCSRAVETYDALAPMQSQSHRLLTLGDAPVDVRRGLRVSGWRALVQSLHASTRVSWTRQWSSMQQEGCLADGWDRDEHDLVDVVHFVLWYRKTRASQNQADSVATRRVLLALRDALVAYLGAALDTYIVQVYLPDRAKKPPPALISPKKSAVRRYVQVQPEAIWDLFSQALDSGASVEQIAVIRSRDVHVGCSESRALAWLAKKVEMYRERRRLAFDRVRHLNIVADPSTHNKQETMASIVWSWQVRVAAHGDLQIIPTTKQFLPSEQDLPESIANLHARGRLERVATFRQLQALSNVIKSLGHWRGLEDFMLPSDWNRIRPVETDEVRVVRAEAMFNRAVLVNRRTQRALPILPDDVFASAEAPLAATQGINLLVTSLDQGSVGAAGYAYSDSIGALVHTKWDKFHRAIRDINLVVEHSAHGLFLKTRLFTSYLWGINQKPFGTGLFQSEKKHVLNVFLATCSIDTPVWRKYLARIARAVGTVVTTREDEQALFDRLPVLARSWCLSLEISKLGRWFSWNSCAQEQLDEFWIGKMLLEFHLEGVRDPDEHPVAFDDLLGAARAKTPQAELAKLKAANGGLRLAYRLMTTKLWQYAKILYVVTRPCWSWYSAQVKRVRQAKDTLSVTLAATQGAWHTDRQLSETFRDALQDRRSLSYMGLPLGTSPLTDRLLELTWALVGKRAWSLAARFHGPPECYAGLMSSCPLLQRRAANQLRDDWKALLSLELRRLSDRVAERLWKDIHFARNMPIRVLFVLFEAGRFEPNFPAGKYWPWP